MAFNTNTTGAAASAGSVSSIVAPNVTAISGTFASPNVISAVGGISILSGKQKQIIFIKSNGGAVLISANPQISVGTVAGQEIVIYGTDDTDIIGLSDGTGIKTTGIPTLASRTNITFIWDGSIWCETSRFGV